MKTLIVNSYHGNSEQKIRPVQEMVSLFSEHETANDLDVAPDYDLESFNAVVLSGSPNLISRNEYLPRYVEFLRHLRRPTLGICYGHQLLAHAFGARVIDGARMLEGYGTIRVLEEEPLFRDMPDEITLLESHREYVAAEDLAQSKFDLMASSATCAVEAIHHTERPLFGVQFHLERSGPNGEQIMSNFFRFVRDYKPMPEDE